MPSARWKRIFIKFHTFINMAWRSLPPEQGPLFPDVKILAYLVPGIGCGGR
jgi:hypothetical protein